MAATPFNGRKPARWLLALGLLGSALVASAQIRPVPPVLAADQANGLTLEQRLRRVDHPVMPTPEEWMKFIRERRAAEQGGD